MHDYYKEMKEKFLVLRTALQKVLLMQGITKVCAEYSGCGDSGQIDELTFFHGTTGAPIEPEFPDDVLVKVKEYTHDGRFELVENERPLNEDDVETMFYKALGMNCPGWEINEGSSGNILWDVENDKVKLNHSYYVPEEVELEI